MQEKSVYDEFCGNKHAAEGCSDQQRVFAAAMNLTSGKSTIK
jgi:hypothetical protein